VTRPRVVVVRGHQVNPWELRPWQELGDHFDVVCLVSRSNVYETASLGLSQVPVHAVSDLVPSGRLRRFVARTPVNRYVGLGKHLASADIVHAAEIFPWWSLQAATEKRRRDYRLVLTVWETLPLIGTYRNVFSRPYRRRIIGETDLFLAATERARAALILEGVPADKVMVSPPGIDLERFRGDSAAEPGQHVILSAGRLVWEKGHQDVLRALAALRHRLVTVRDGAPPRLLIVGSGAEERRLLEYATELGVADLVELRRHVPYDEMPGVYAGASCLVLASLPVPSWEEQFGMVLAEAMAAGLPILASTSGAIPEVAGPTATYFAAGDWVGLAKLLEEGPLSRPPGTRVEHPAERLQLISTTAAAGRLVSAYERVLAHSVAVSSSDAGRRAERPSS
jgi:glycosyltransferase involved in cell wall biosynthesis